MKKTATTSVKLAWKDVGLIAQGFTLAMRAVKGVAKNISAEYGLGPHAAWILRLIDSGMVAYPLDVTNFLRISRSVITEELAKLTEARLITYRKSTGDRRRVELALTPLGEKMSFQVREELVKMIVARFADFSREEVQQFSKMLNAFVAPDLPSLQGGRVKRRRASSKALKRQAPQDSV